MVNVCDAIMGTGKSTAAINYINSNPDKKFVYITPYLDEAKRIKKGCPDAKFVEPSDKIEEYKFKKSLHTAALLKQGKNIATTHQAFKNYTADMLESVKENNYTLIIDENVDILERYDTSVEDIEIAVDAGLIKKDGLQYTINRPVYNGKAFKELYTILSHRELIHITNGDKDLFFYWVLSSELVKSFEDTFVLTYLFESQSIHHFLEMSDIPYEYIGIKKIGEHDYIFSKEENYVPEYVSHIKDMITILDKDKLNAIGEGRFALSANWYRKNELTDEIVKLRNNVYNYFNNMAERDVDPNARYSQSNNRLWGGFKDSFDMIKGKGYTKSFLTFNAKATNAYKDRTCLAYISNIFMNPNEKILYESRGVKPNEDMYALSIMIQWIWRSAIREGNPVEIYIPSSRMRNLLIKWMDDVSKGGDVND